MWDKHIKRWKENNKIKKVNILIDKHVMGNDTDYVKQKIRDRDDVDPKCWGGMFSFPDPRLFYQDVHNTTTQEAKEISQWIRVSTFLQSELYEKECPVLNDYDIDIKMHKDFWGRNDTEKEIQKDPVIIEIAEEFIILPSTIDKLENMIPDTLIYIFNIFIFLIASLFLLNLIGFVRSVTS